MTLLIFADMTRGKTENLKIDTKFNQMTFPCTYHYQTPRNLGGEACRKALVYVCGAGDVFEKYKILLSLFAYYSVKYQRILFYFNHKRTLMISEVVKHLGKDFYGQKI
jgi:hypothetical protein